MTMRSRLLLCLIQLLAFLPLQAAPLAFLFPKRRMEVITVTDMTAEGKKLQPPTPANPVYYAGFSLGFNDLGGLMGGEKIPPKEDMLRTITKVLAEQGYKLAGKNTPAPSVILAYSWGTLYADTGFNFKGRSRPRNQLQILGFLGGSKLGFSNNDFDPMTAPLGGGLMFKDADATDFLMMSTDDFYIATVAAYDFAALMQAKQKKLLWITRISCPAKGYWLADVMPTMMSVAGPNIGRETAKPVWVNVSDKYRPSVTLKELQFLDYMNKAPQTPPQGK